ncbi:hypothetical protein [Agromyces humi]|uniref:hypothetical protein n=1 Tax=Agromyces humi TaxID=1766800 RepID=UPI00193969E2|nr:hypothetical protein [Agromyces humi]
MSDAVRALRDAAPSALAVLVRRYGDFAACEDAMQEALIAASGAWPPEQRYLAGKAESLRRRL